MTTLGRLMLSSATLLMERHCKGLSKCAGTDKNEPAVELQYVPLNTEHDESCHLLRPHVYRPKPQTTYHMRSNPKISTTEMLGEPRTQTETGPPFTNNNPEAQPNNIWCKKRSCQPVNLKSGDEPALLFALTIRMKSNMGYLVSLAWT
jgi:hypothetical protein